MFKSIPLKTAFNEEKIEIVSYVIFNDIIDIKVKDPHEKQQKEFTKIEGEQIKN